MGTKDLSTLIEDIDKLFDQSSPREVSEENLDIFCTNIRQILKDRLSHEPSERRPIRFSALGKPDRQVWYDAHPDGTEEKLRPSALRKFLFGDIIEQMLLFLCREAGHSVTHEQEQVTCGDITGSIDAIIDGVVVDVKSASPFGYRKFKEGRLLEEDPFGYVAQLAGYASILTPGEGAAWLAMDKVGGSLCLARLSSSVVSDNPPAPRIDHLKEIVEKDEPPSRCYEDVPDGKSGNKKLATGCSYCAHRFRCWPNLRGFVYSTGPRFLTKVVREPDVPEMRRGDDAETETS